MPPDRDAASRATVPAPPPPLFRHCESARGGSRLSPGMRIFGSPSARDPGRAAAEIAGLRELRRGGLRRHRPDIKRVAMKAAAAHVAAAAKIDPLVVGDDLGEDLLPRRDIARLFSTHPITLTEMAIGPGVLLVSPPTMLT